MTCTFLQLFLKARDKTVFFFWGNKQQNIVNKIIKLTLKTLLFYLLQSQYGVSVLFFKKESGSREFWALESSVWSARVAISPALALSRPADAEISENIPRTSWTFPQPFF